MLFVVCCLLFVVCLLIVVCSLFVVGCLSFVSCWGLAPGRLLFGCHTRCFFYGKGLWGVCGQSSSSNRGHSKPTPLIFLTPPSSSGEVHRGSSRGDPSPSISVTRPCKSRSPPDTGRTVSVDEDAIQICIKNSRLSMKSRGSL